MVHICVDILEMTAGNVADKRADNLADMRYCRAMHFTMFYY